MVVEEMDKDLQFLKSSMFNLFFGSLKVSYPLKSLMSSSDLFAVTEV